MIERIYPRKIVCRGRRRSSVWHILAVLLMLASGVLAAAMQKAQATRHGSTVRADGTGADGHAHVPGSVTLAEMAERQRVKRVRAAPSDAADSALSNERESDSWQIQFGAFASADAARQLQARLNARPFAIEARTSTDGGGGLVRVHRAVADRATAMRLCALAEADGFSCFVRAR